MSRVYTTTLACGCMISADEASAISCLAGLAIPDEPINKEQEELHYKSWEEFNSKSESTEEIKDQTIGIINWNDIIRLELSDFGLGVYYSYCLSLGIPFQTKGKMLEVHLWEAARIFGHVMNCGQTPFKDSTIKIR